MAAVAWRQTFKVTSRGSLQIALSRLLAHRPMTSLQLVAASRVSFDFGIS
jgi:hypothetical protein